MVKAVPASASKDKKKPRTVEPATGTSRKHKQRIEPYHAPPKSTQYELFGSDSNNEEAVSCPEKKGKQHQSFFVRKLPKGFSRIVKSKNGSFFIQLKVFKSIDVENQCNDSKNAILIIKNKTENNTEAWNYLSKFIQSTQTEFRNYRTFFFSADGSSAKRMKMKKRRSASHHTESAAKKTRPTANDLFGNDSGDQAEDGKLGKKLSPISSYITRRVANGYSRQNNDKKEGTHFIDLRVYKCDEIERVQPMNRWRHAIITIRNRTDDNADAWRMLTEFIKATRKEFRDCVPDFIGSPF